jgi:hypothetical protein
VGLYEQQGAGVEKQFRLELKTQLESNPATLLMVCGRQHLWIRRDFGGEQRSLARVNLLRFREAIEESGSPLTLDPSPAWLGLLSLPKSLAMMGEWFEFTPAQEAQLGERPVLRLVGAIKPDLRRNYLNGGTKGQGGEQIPDSVVLTLGRDETLPLFPYRIEFLRTRTMRTLTGRTSAPAPMLAIDFHSVKIRTDLDERRFDYFPGDQEIEDRTGLFLERLGLGKK